MSSQTETFFTFRAVVKKQKKEKGKEKSYACIGLARDISIITGRFRFLDRAIFTADSDRCLLRIRRRDDLSLSDRANRNYGTRIDEIRAPSQDSYE
jgi:hypothetical protein